MDGPCKLTPYDEWHGSPAFSQSEQDDVVLTGPGLKHLYLDVCPVEIAERLNEQHAEIEKLKSDLQEAHDQYAHLVHDFDVVAAELAEFKRKQKEAVDRRARNILGIDKEEK